MPFIGAAIAGIGSAFAAGGFFTTFLGRLLISVAASALMQALAPKPREPGIKTEVTQTGGINPCSFVLMKYATAGARVCPPMSHGSAGKTPNAYLTEVIDLGDIAGQALARVIINDEYVTLGGPAHPDYGLPVTGALAGYAWIKYYDGSQTAVDPMLLAKYSGYPERPWSADMIGRGMCYAICTFRYNRDKFQSLPRLRFEMGGIPLYDPRKDSTVGGSGAHRWTNKATWEATVNPMVAIYNIKRGIGLADGSTWGGGFPAADVPLASYFAAMNECDVLVDNGAAGTEPQFRAGLEVGVDEKPADIIAELMKVCSGQTAEIGGIWKVRAGPPGIPVMSFTDADIIITSPQDYSPFPGFSNSYNGVHATYPEPSSLWEQKEAPPLYNAGFEVLDQGQRLIADLGLSACPYGAQVRRLQKAYIAEERRFRRHGQTLPPDFAALEPLDATAWTSTANDYTARVFEVSEIIDDLMTAHQRISFRERDASDYVYGSLAAAASVSTVSVVPAPQTVPGFDVLSASVPDATGTARRPALKLIWDGDQDDARGISWEIRVAATAVVIARGSTHEVPSGELLIAEGILPSTAYEARAILIADRAMLWTAWDAATTPAVLPVQRADIADGAVSDQFQVIALGPYTVADTPNGTVILNLDMGAIGPGQGWSRHIQLYARLPTISSDATIQLQRRYKILGGVFTAWAVIETFTVNSGFFGSGVYDQYSDRSGLAGAYDDYEYRLVVAVRPPSGSGDWLKDIYLTVAKVTK